MEEEKGWSRSAVERYAKIYSIAPLQSLGFLVSKAPQSFSTLGKCRLPGAANIVEA